MNNTAPSTICKNCNVAYKPNPTSKNSKFCSAGCYHKYRKAHPDEYNFTSSITVECELCGKAFHKKPSAYKQSTHHYCSRACSNRAQSEILKQHPELRTSQGREVICKNCGQAFYVKPHRAGKAKYCSKACFHAHRFGRQLPNINRPDIHGASNPNYKGTNNLVTSRETYFSHLPRHCLICGFDVVVDVHHITPRRHNGTNDIGNLIGLCPNHHRMADLGMISRDELTEITRAAIAQQ